MFLVSTLFYVYAFKSPSLTNILPHTHLPDGCTPPGPAPPALLPGSRTALHTHKNSFYKTWKGWQGTAHNFSSKHGLQNENAKAWGLIHQQQGLL